MTRAPQGETGHEDQYETDFNRWLDSLSPGQREQITRDIEAAHDLIRDGLTAAAHDAEVRAQALAPIREALAGHPHCDIHPDGDSIACGWKRAVASVQAALDKEDR